MAYQHFERPTTHKPTNTWLRPVVYIVLVAVTGLIAGGLGFALLIRLYEPAVQLNLLPENNQLQRRSLTVRIDQPIIGAAETVQPSLVLFLKHREVKNVPVDLLIDPSDIVGQGAVLTSDGWLLGQFPAAVPPQFDAYIDGEVYGVTRTVKDTFTSTTFVKIDAGNLVPVQFTESLPAAGTFVFSSAVATGGGYQIGTNHIALSRWTPIKTKNDEVKNGIQMSEFIRLDHPATDQVVFGSDGTFLGIISITDRTSAIPSRQIKLSFEQMLKGISDVDPGLSYIDSALSTRIGGTGATIYHPTRDPIRPNGFAARAKLSKLDTIISINGTALSYDMPFEYVWRLHQHEDTIRMTIRRNGREASVELKNN